MPHIESRLYIAFPDGLRQVYPPHSEEDENNSEIQHSIPTVIFTASSRWSADKGHGCILNVYGKRGHKKEIEISAADLEHLSPSDTEYPERLLNILEERTEIAPISVALY